ncbi:kinase-like protein [Fomitopsis serialis]|uniref:kinase-like protein n=1 Tax=Fomitopsis serialis TaxID=139415 RepID=UPI0020089E29|nr:kinase-like protein [Neoantrodia serialis]KAH9921143.1 kinase-like protein [Neoantrodia serialis]
MATGALSEATFAQSLAHPSPATPAPRYPGWVTEVVAPLSGFIDEALDPRTLFGDLREIGEGESGSVYAARLLTPSGSQRSDDAHSSDVEFVAIKNVPLVPNGSPKLVDLQRELSLMRRVRHQNVLSMEGVFVDIVEDALWIRMELMERSLADVLLLVDEGIVIEEKPIALLVSDVLHGLSYLQRLGIAHRDLRSDNLLVNTDFSSAVRVSKEEPSRSDNVGVIYWQAPEVRTPPYNALKVDVWSLGATVWEMAQAEPPFSDIDDPRLIPHRWPSLHQAEIYSRSFHDFLHLCSQPSSLRPDPNELLKTPFIRNASGRPTILKILSECRAMRTVRSNGTVSVS